MVMPQREDPARWGAPHESVCCACGSADVRLFYEGRGVPAQSCILVDDAHLARDYPTGSIRLGLCDSCGLIQNTAFDPALIDYSKPAEESQAFSPTFSAYACELAQSLVARYGLRGKTVLEIGSGKGDFLRLLAEEGIMAGIGIDPGYLPDRQGGDAGPRLHFLTEYFTNDHVGLPADLICCRHVLEHIRPVAAFVRLVKRAADATRCPVVFFEVPDVRRVLAEGAFWDVYYEHCSYFSAGSLARLFRALGFRVTRLALAYDRQYVLLEARSVADENGRVQHIEAAAVGDPVTEETVEELEREVRFFTTSVDAKVSYWRDVLGEARRQGRRIVLWGGGSKAVGFLSAVEARDEVDCVVDINPFKQGLYLPGSGHRVLAPEALVDRRPDMVVVMNPIYLGEIEVWLAQHGVSSEVVGLA